MRSRVIAGVWWLLVAAALLLAPLALRDRLPDPMATHWGTTGSVPDGSSSLTGFVITIQVIWAGLWVLFFLLGRQARVRRPARMTFSACVFGTGVLMLSVAASTLSVNLDAATWRDALLPAWHIPVALAATAATMALAAYLVSEPADDPRAESQARPQLRLNPGQRAVWVSRVVNPWLTVAMFGALVVTVVTVALASTGAAGDPVRVILPLAVILLLAGLVSMAVSVRVRDDLITIGFGPLGWPARRIPLSKVESAWSEQRQPGEVGGWGFRGLPGNATIMLRGGECLVLGYRSGGRLAISVDDAERGASLINALIAERVQP
ncbi:DUF1648 domain-containing protein [Nonomuraea sp. MG754425]|uniref:DUF1648 domain-containing protein n=1 Tax=Nonomuraea sp. MG754425 TaxID=2570319 RepID=UPI001F37335F|nr:DUF1648 domain-containing protein [Nonomuraea sp. MG754425]MCF6475461.1 DUF1648 domain-containing protein [Nonomuraea sp. MG754425]